MKVFKVLLFNLLIFCVSAYSLAQTTVPSSKLHPCGFQVIEVPGAQPQSSLPASINDEGVIVGSFLDVDFKARGFILNHGKFTAVDFPDGTNTHLRQINNRGQILGVVDRTNVSQTPVSFVLEDGKFTVLNFANVPSNALTGFNDFDEFVGIDQGSGLQGFVVVGGQRTDLPSFNDSAFSVSGINDRGVLVGTASSPNSPVPDVSLVLRYGQFSRFPTLPPSAPRADGNSVIAINNRNQVVGSIFDSASNTSQAYFLSEDGAYTIFGFPGDVQNAALAVNDRLQIIGVSADASFHGKRWVTRLCTSEADAQ